MGLHFSQHRIPDFSQLIAQHQLPFVETRISARSADQRDGDAVDGERQHRQ
jgi:hypothetical protein